jgi:hypothetical protein
LSIYRSMTSWYWKIRTDVLEELVAFIFRIVYQQSLFMDCTDDGGTNLFSEDLIVRKKRRVNIRLSRYSPLEFISCVIFIQCFAIGVSCKTAKLLFPWIRKSYLEVIKGLLHLLWALTQRWLLRISVLQCNCRHEIMYDKSYD